MEGNVLNINGISNSQVALQQLTSVLSKQPVKASEKIMLEETVESTSSVVKDPPFYEYQKEPWLTEPGYELASNLKEYVAWKSMEVMLDLGLAKLAHDSFMKKLADTHPEIASKSFGFTLDADASIKIIDYNKVLTDSEQRFLIDSLSNTDGLKLHSTSAAKGFMALVDHDHETFGGRHKLGIESFQFVIDFGRILSLSVEKMQGEWVAQIQQNAERRDFPYISSEA